MAVTSIGIAQGNTEIGCSLLAVSNPLVFLVDVHYSGTAPDVLAVDVLDSDTNVLGTFHAIPYSDNTISSVRQFAFIANDILKAYMDGMDDFESYPLSLEFVENITKEFTIRFYDIPIGDAEPIETTIDVVACHAARQFGEKPCMESICRNDDETYYAGVGMPVYVYFYNGDEGNSLTIDSGTVSDLALLDYDDIALLDSDNSLLKSIL